MSEKQAAILNISKALLGVSFATLAALGSASGNLWVAGLTAVPAAGLTTSDTIGALLTKLKVKKEKMLQLPMPPWWTRGFVAWEDLCSEVAKHLPQIMQGMAERLRTEQGVLTAQIVRKTFIDVVGDEPLTWEFDPIERRHFAEYIATPLLQNVADVLKTVIEPIREDRALVDLHTTAVNAKKITEVLEKAISILEKIYQETQKQGGMPVSDTSIIPGAESASTPQVVATTQNVLSTAALLQRKIEYDDYDVFICYNAADELEVMNIGKLLKQQGILPWFDVDDEKPGEAREPQQEQQIAKIRSAAVFVGKSAIARWQLMQANAFLRQFVQRGCPVIPVLLKDAPQMPQLPIFLEGMVWVDFRRKEPNPMGQLLWGITGKRHL